MVSCEGKKESYLHQLQALLDSALPILLVSADRISSSQFTHLRRLLFPKATVLYAKNTLIKSALMRNTGKERELEGLIPFLKGNIAMIFCKAGVGEVLEVLEEATEPAQAVEGTVAECDVYVPQGPTQLDPTRTAYFAALNIPTKISKGRIEILARVQILQKGQIVGPAPAAMLHNLGILPFSHRFEVICYYENGQVYPKEVVPMLSDSAILSKFAIGVRYIASIALEAGYPTSISLLYSVLRGVFHLAAIAAEADYWFPLGDSTISWLQTGEIKVLSSETHSVSEENKENSENEDTDIRSIFDF